jgi:hypothetical protein
LIISCRPRLPARAFFFPIGFVQLLRAMFDVGYFPPNTPPP